MRRVISLILALNLLSSGVAAQTVPASTAKPHIERLARVARLWGTIRYLHPYLAYKEIDWDAALVAAIPRIREAKSTQDYRSAVQGLLDALGDPVTRVLDAEPVDARGGQHPPGSQKTLFNKLEDGVLVVDLGRYPQTVDPGTLLKQAAALKELLAQSSAVVIDLRVGRNADELATYWGAYVLGDLAGTLVPRTCRAPAQRYLLHSGFRPHDGSTSGGYWSGFLTQFADTFEPSPGRKSSPERVVFLIDPWSSVPAIALALRAAGDARIVAEGTVGEESIVTSQKIELGEGLVARVRVSEIIPSHGWNNARPDVEVAPGASEAALGAAVSEARRKWPAAAEAAAPPKPLPDAVFRPDRQYADMVEPGLEYRQLAVIRAWNVIHYFYPYLHLIGDWDGVLPQFLARMEEAKNGREYALTLVEMMTRVPDGHTRVWGRPEVEQPFGDASLPIQVRPVEGHAVAVRVTDEIRQAGIDVGDAILGVDGQSVEALVERFSRVVTASTQPALLNRIYGRFLLAGPAGSTATVKVQRLDGSIHEVRLVRDPKKRLPPSDRGDVVRLLPGNLGYVDLTRLSPTEVDSMFEKVKDTRGLIFDMRGYPQGTAWSIAPRINTRHAKIGAQFRRSQVSAFSGEEGQSGFYFSQPLPVLPKGKTLYTGKTVMLIDDRAISQSEHSGLFFEAANGTTFVGTATAGANGDVTQFSMPGGLWVGFSGHDVRHADGRQLQRVGLAPDVEAAPTRAGLRAGKDEVLEAAVRYLQEAAVKASGGISR